MECTVRRKDLVESLQLALAVADTGNILPLLSHVLLTAEQDNCLRLRTTDMEMSADLTCPAVACKTPGAWCLPAKKLYRYLQASDAEEVFLRSEKNHAVRLAAGGNTARFAGLNPEQFPPLPKMPENTVLLRVAMLRELLRHTQFAISKEDSRYVLQGALLAARREQPAGGGEEPVPENIETGRLTMVATDGHRLAKDEAPGPAGCPQVLLPAKAAQELGRWLERTQAENLAFAADPQHLYFKILEPARDGELPPERLLLARKLVGTFPNYEAVLPEDNSNCARINRAALQAALGRVALFADGRTNGVELRLDDAGLHLRAAQDGGESEETVAAAVSGNPLTIAFNGRYLEEFLDAAPEAEEIQMLLKDNDKAAEFRVVGNTAYRYIVMPQRL